jgi:hypothetical protein
VCVRIECLRHTKKTRGFLQGTQERKIGEMYSYIIFSWVYINIYREMKIERNYFFDFFRPLFDVFFAAPVRAFTSSA